MCLFLQTSKPRSEDGTGTGPGATAALTPHINRPRSVSPPYVPSWMNAADSDSGGGGQDEEEEEEEVEGDRLVEMLYHW